MSSEMKNTLSAKYSGTVPVFFPLCDSKQTHVNQMICQNMFLLYILIHFSSGSCAKMSATTIPQNSAAFVFIGKRITVLIIASLHYTSRYILHQISTAN